MVGPFIAPRAVPRLYNSPENAAMRAAAQPFPESGLRLVGCFGPQSEWMSIAISTSSPHQSVGGRERESLYSSRVQSSPVESSRVQSSPVEKDPRERGDGLGTVAEEAAQSPAKSAFASRSACACRSAFAWAPKSPTAGRTPAESFDRLWCAAVCAMGYRKERKRWKHRLERDA